MSYLLNPLVEWLLSRAYGQGGSVAVPTDGHQAVQVPMGEFPAGIDDVLSHLSQHYHGWTNTQQELDWCFLVGGPGNGKSESLRALAGKLQVSLPARAAGQPVPRVVPSTWPAAAQPIESGLHIAFINDASIPRPDSNNLGGPGSLFLDVCDGLCSQDPVAIFGNVNRGILVEEAGMLGPSQMTSPAAEVAAAIVRWLAHPASDASGSSPGIVTTVSIGQASPFYGQIKVPVPGTSRTLRIHAVFLDVLSLLEPRPGGNSHVIDFSTEPPLVAEYHTLGSLVNDNITREGTIAGQVLKSVVAQSRWQDGRCLDPATGDLCDAYTTCPFAQNVKWLQSDRLRPRFLDALRAAEVAAARRFTYRDLLGHISLAILGGPEEAWLKGVHPCNWSREQREALNNGEKGVTVTLMDHRLFANLYSTTIESQRTCSERELKKDTLYRAIKVRANQVGEPPRVQTFERAFREIDPARDADPWDGLRTRVLDAVESLDVLAPSAQIAGWTELPAESRSEIEVQVDHALREEIATELQGGTRAAGNRVRALRRWRSSLLLRQVALALGHFGFGTAIQAWLAEHENALRQGQRMKLGDGIHNLIMPLDGHGHVFLALLRPRTYCLCGDLPTDTVLVPVRRTDLGVVVVAHGDALMAEVQVLRVRERLAPLVLATLVIDLAVAREAVLHSDGDARSFTEIGYTAFARIERARASLISRERMKGTPAQFTDGIGNVYQLTGNPGGPVPLRVQGT